MSAFSEQCCSAFVGDSNTGSQTRDGGAQESRTEGSLPVHTQSGLGIPTAATIDEEGFVRVPCQLLARYHELEAWYWHQVSQDIASKRA